MFDTVWRRLARGLLCVFLLASASAALAGEAVKKAPAPGWATALALPKLNPERARQHTEGLGYLLFDHQVRAEPGGDTSYRRTAYQVVDRTGLEAGASLSIDFDPSRETLVLHHARVWRNGVARDRLAKARLQVIAREDELDEGIVTGHKTAHIEFEDVRVGDIVDYAYSWIDRDPLLSGHVFASQTLGWIVPVEVTRFRALWPHGGAKPTIVRLGGADAPRVTTAGGWDAYEWTVTDPDPFPEEQDLPDGVAAMPKVRISSLSSWGQVADAAARLYAGHRAPAAWKGEIARIAAHPNPNDRITEAVRLVQDKVRYVSLSIGDGSYRPRSPDAVVASGYGDCKDKALLLALVLRDLGVDAAPALTDVDNGPGLPLEPPSMASFDHVIVRIRTAAGTYWVDATGSHEGGRFPNLSGLDYAWALPIVAGQTKLERIPRPTAPTRNYDVHERYVLPAGATGDMTLDVTTVFSGLEADYIRSELASRSMAQTEKRYLDYYGEMYPGLRAVRPVQVADNRDANVVTVREAYLIPRGPLSKGGLAKFRIRAQGAEAYAQPAASQRRNPLWLPWPVNKRHTIVLVTPGRKPAAPPKAKVDGDAFRFTAEVARKPGELILTYAVVGKADSLAADKVAEHRERVGELNDAVYWDLDLTTNGGGTIGEESVGWAVAAFFLVVGLMIAFVVGSMRWGGRADDAHAAEGAFYPVTTAKFVIMSAATFGLYPFFWMWKCWRWARRHGGEDLSPFWRSFFSLIWLYPLFRRVNERAGDRGLVVRLGVAAAAAYVAWTFGWGVADNALDLPPGVGLLSEAAFLFVVPAVIATRRANAERPEIVAANSRFSGLSWAAIGAGACLWALMVAAELPS